MGNDDFLKVAKQAALEAGEIISKYFGKKHQYKYKNKDESDFATTADLKAEQKIVQILTKNFPTHNIIAEESGRRQNNSEFTWQVDPLDGSFTFGQNIPYFAVSIGLLKNEKPIMGVINHISFKNLYWAKIGDGAFLNGKRINVSKKNELEVAAGSLDHGHRQKRQAKVDLYVNKLVTKIGSPYEFGSAAVTLTMVANGNLDMYVNQAYCWDFAAGTVIVREAGGRVTDFAGNEPDWTKQRLNIVASNGLIHDQILEALR